MIRRDALRAIFAAVAAGVLPPAASADDAVWRRLAAPGHVVLLRHATAPGIGDPPGFDLSICDTQRNLSEAGRAEARAIGSTLRDRGVAFRAVRTSAWCRCQETARLVDAGPAEVWPLLNSFFADPGSGAGQIAALRAALAVEDLSRPLLLVTHQVVISALAGVPAASGEMVVLTRDARGGLTLVGSLSVGRLR